MPIIWHYHSDLQIQHCSCLTDEFNLCEHCAGINPLISLHMHLPLTHIPSLSNPPLFLTPPSLSTVYPSLPLHHLISNPSHFPHLIHFPPPLLPLSTSSLLPHFPPLCLWLACADPCSSGGTCVNTMGTYECRCLPQFTGHRCQFSDICTNSATCPGSNLCVPTFSVAAGFICMSVQEPNNFLRVTGLTVSDPGFLDDLIATFIERLQQVKGI